MIIDYEDYLEAGLHIFPLHPIMMGGKCGCGDDDCLAAGKHPVMSNWQHITTWDEEQLAYLTGEDGIGDNQFVSGFGVNLAKQLLVIDVDSRNGGVESFDKLCKDLSLDLADECGFIVETGSGGGSRHLYFRSPQPPLPLVTTHRDYPGIDFKSTGFVVGCGSDHVSGNRYSSLKGSPKGIDDAPGELISLLTKPERIRTFEAGKAVDFEFSELRRMVLHIPNGGRDYEKWVRVGMGIHETTSGSEDGYQLWVEWSALCKEAHNESQMPMKWGSFGKSPASIVTVGTLLLWAKEGGYSEPVTFESTEIWQDDEADNITNKSVREGVNLKTPPGLVGALAEWINSRQMFPREHLAVGAALFAVSSAAGLRYRVGPTRATLNQIIFGIASSGTGKDAILQRLVECFSAAGILAAVHGSIKSEQEITRNIIRNQASIYTIDEIGEFLSKVNNAKKRGSSSYLESIMAAIMSIFSKANGVLPVGGDIKEEIKERIQREVSREQKKLDDNNGSEERLERLLNELRSVDEGIIEPFLSIYGTAEPHSFGASIDRQMIVGGFMGRSLVIEEHNNVPRLKAVDEISHEPLPPHLAMQLAALYSGGSTYANDGRRVERQGDVVVIGMSPEALKASTDVYEYWYKVAKQEADDGTGLETIVARAWETTLKVAGALAVASGVATLEHMRYAHALVYRSTMWKLNKAKADDGAEAREIDVKSEGVLSAVKSVLDKKEAMTIGVIRNRYRGKYTKQQIEEAVAWLVSEGKVSETVEKKNNGRAYSYYTLV